LSSNVKIKCKNPHEFLISVIYSLSYASTVRPILHHSLLGFGYVFTALDVPSIYNMAAPDFLLVNARQRIAIAVECKGDIVSDTEKIRQKFSDQVIDAIRTVIHDTRGEYEIEFVIHTFDTYVNHYANMILDIREHVNRKVFLWTTSAVPQIMANQSIGGYTEIYTLKKPYLAGHDIKHIDSELDGLLTQGIGISESEIICNPLTDPEAEYSVLFYEISEYILRMALTDRYRGQEIMITELANHIKRDYQSPIKIDELIRVVRDVFNVFPELGEVKTSSYTVVFKKKPRINTDEFYNIREKIKGMGNKEAKSYVRELIEKRRKR